MTHRDNFLSMCHTLYDKLHGEDNIKKIFEPINEEQLQKLINIYNEEFYKRVNLIEVYIANSPNIKNRVKLRGGGELNTSAFYLNAMQHYTTGDY